MQLSAVRNPSDVPTLAVELTTLDDAKQNAWGSKLVFQCDPLRELPVLCKYLMFIGEVPPKLVLSRQTKDSKSLTVKWQETNLYIGIYQNNTQHPDEGGGYSRTLDPDQVFMLRSLALSQLANIYGVTVTECMKLLKYPLMPGFRGDR